jgi:rhodanese-related sulfurtransferase
VTPENLAGQQEPVQVVDVRYPNEWEAGHIEGSVHIPADELDDRLGELSRDRPVVTVCRSGSRSAAAAEQLAVEGFTVENLEGGVLAWVEAGRSLVTGDGSPGGDVVEPEPPRDDRPEHIQRLQSEFLSVLMAVEEHFGDSEPSDDEVRAFLRDRLLSEGRSPEEADAFMAEIEGSG